MCPKRISVDTRYTTNRAQVSEEKIQTWKNIGASYVTDTGSKPRDPGLSGRKQERLKEGEREMIGRKIDRLESGRQTEYHFGFSIYLDTLRICASHAV